MEMSKEVLSAVSHSYEMATYSTPELRGLFNDWILAIAEEVLDFLKKRDEVDTDEVAAEFRMTRESAIFILGKLAREEKIKMQATGKERQK